MNRFLKLAALTLLALTIAAPSFACRTCDEAGMCVRDPLSGTTCVPAMDTCTISGPCAIAHDRVTLLDQFEVSSVEVTHPNGLTTTTNAAAKALAANAAPQTNIHTR